MITPTPALVRGRGYLCEVLEHVDDGRYAAPSFCFGWFVCLVSWFSRFGFPSLSLSLSFFRCLACLTAQATCRVGDIAAAAASAAFAAAAVAAVAAAAAAAADTAAAAAAAAAGDDDDDTGNILLLLPVLSLR